MYLIPEQIELFYRQIVAYDTIIIHRHQRPDPDAIGSQLGLKYLLQNAFPDKRILAAGTTTKGLLWLGEMDKVISDDYYHALVIVTDTANQPRIDGELYSSGEELIKIDHHPEVDEYGSLQIVHTNASSCSEIIIAISDYLGARLPLTLKAATLLYAGILGDTGRFLYSSTTAFTMQMASKLLAEGIDAFAINDAFQVMTLEEIKFQAFGYENLRVNEDGVAYLRINQSDMVQYGINEEQTNTLVNIASRIKGVLCWVVFVEQESEQFFYRCRIRSKGPVINDIAALHHGGGHPMASGANAYSEEEMVEIIQQMSEVARQYRKQ